MEAAALVVGIVDAINNLLPLFIDEDIFPPYAIALTLNSANQFGGADSKKLRTGNISGHGGTYRIGYRWHLT